ncbi:hypothetical protein Tsubulata_036660, partial [Turnera subulata]
MPFNILITYVIGSVLGWIVIQCTRPPSHLRGLIVCCAAFCKEKRSPFGSPGICQSYG